MYSSYKYLAAVWKQIQDRADISSILREVIGQHVLRDLSQEDDDHTTQTVVWIKTIYDIQRCYLCGANSSEIQTQIASCLLPFDLLLSSLLYLISVKVKHFPSQTALLTKEFMRPRLILAQTVLSGLRLFSLGETCLSTRQRQRLQVALNEAWKDDSLRGAEACIIQDVFAAMMDVLSEAHHIDAYGVERESAMLPKYVSGLYPLQIRPEVSVTPLVHALAEEEDDWVDAYCVLYDTLWAIECALTRRYIDLSQKSGTSDLEPTAIENDEIFEQLYQQRSSFIASAFHVKGPMVPSDPLMESLAIHLLDWDTTLDSFLSQQESMIQHRMSLPRMPTHVPNYGKQISKLKPYFENALLAFADWLSTRTTVECVAKPIGKPELPLLTRSSIATWITTMASPNSTLASQHLQVPQVPVYIVGCPKLHAIPKTYLAEQLRWTDKWAYQGVENDTPTLNWKEGVQCPGCPSGEKIKCARLLEPLRVSSSSSPIQRDQAGVNSSSQHSGESSNSYIATITSTASRSASDGASFGASYTGRSTMEIPEARSDGSTHRSADAHPPQYTACPTSPLSLSLATRHFGSNMPEWPVSPLVESFDVPTPTPVNSRLSMNLPIPVLTPENTFDNTNSSASLDAACLTPDVYPTTLTWTADTVKKSRTAGRSSKLANSMRRKSSTKSNVSASLPKDTSFVFSSGGASILLWSRSGEHVSRFELGYSGEPSILGSCRYEAKGVETAAAGTQKCVVVTTKCASSRMLRVFDGLDPEIRLDFELEVTGRAHEISIAVSKDDQHLAISINDQIDLFTLKDGLKRVAFHHQMDVFELRGGISHRRSIAVTRTTSDDPGTDNEKPGSGSWFSSQSKGLNLKEATEEQQRQTVIVSRKIYFSTDSQRLVAATQLGDHCVYIDVWDVTREPVSTISEHSRSFKLPPWVLNDGDITSVFYDSARRAALVTAFIGKEYPVFVPFPGYGNLQNETYSTKIVAATMSPSGSAFIVANSMTEMIQFEYTAKGSLSPRKLKKSSSKISNSVFKPGAIALAMASEDTVLAFWIKDGKCMLRTIKLGATETVKDLDIRPHHDQLMKSNDGPFAGSTSSLSIAELGA